MSKEPSRLYREEDHGDSEMATSDVDLDVEEEVEDGSIYFHTEGIEDVDDDFEEDDEEEEEDDDDDDVEDGDGVIEDEDDALNRLSQQAVRRRQASVDYEDEEDDSEEVDEDGVEDVDEDEGDEDDDDDDEDEGDEELNPADFLRRLIQARSRSQGNRVRSGDRDDDDDDDNGDTNETRGQEFVDAIQRLMGGGIMFGGPGGTAGIGGIGGGARAGGMPDIGGILGGGTGLHYEIDSLINNLNQRDDPFLILESLNELSERLLMMNGITAERVIPANKLAKCLINIMQDPQLAEDLEVHLVACRCLYNFLEVNLDFIHDALNNGAVEALCEKLLEISYIDLTEQALQTLEMISRDPISHEQIIGCNGLRACLQYLDFFTVHAQRKSLIIVANSCIGGVNVSNFDKVEGEVFQMISNVVRQHDDPVVVENGWLAISRVVMNVKIEGELLETLFGSTEGEDLINEMVKVVVRTSSKDDKTSSSDGANSGNTVTFGTCLNLIRSLTVLVSVGVMVSTQLLSNGIGKVISQSLIAAGRKKKDEKSEILNRNSHVSGEQQSNSNNISSLMSTPKDLLSQFLTLIGYLLPVSYSSLPYSSGNISPDKLHVKELRIQLCTDNEDYWKFVNDTWGLLIHAFQATMDYEIRRKVLINLFRIVSFAKPMDFSKIQDLEKISGLLSSVPGQVKSLLSEKPTHGRIQSQSPLLLFWSTLLISNVLIEKAGGTIIKSFEKEGLINDIESVVKGLNDIGVEEDKDDEDHDELMSSQSNIGGNSATKFIDFEFTKDYQTIDFNTQENVYKKIISLCKEIIHSVTDHRTGNGGTGSSGMAILEEVVNTLKYERLGKLEEFYALFQKMKHSFDCGGVEEISSFELMSSGVIFELVKVLSDEGGYPYKAFVDVYFKDNSISNFVEKLQDCLTRSESFEIIGSSPTNTSGNSNYVSGGFGGLGLANRFDNNSKTASMARQVKIKLVSEDGESSLPIGMQNLILSIHAIATFKSVDTFINQRFKILDGLNAGWNREERQSEHEGDDENQEDNLNGNKGNTRFEFLFDGEVIPTETTIYGAIYRSLQDYAKKNGHKNSDIISQVWSSVHPVKFRAVKTITGEVKESNPDILGFDGSSINYDGSDFEDSTDIGTLSILRLLKILFEMNSHLKPNPIFKYISDDLFKNWKLTVKLNRQFEEPLIVASGTLPGWAISLPKEFPMIFPLDTRIFFLQSTSYGYSRLIHHWQLRTNQEENERNGNGGNSNGNPRPQLGRPARHKVRLSRKLLLQSAVKVLNMYGSTPGVLEIEYFDEVGSGLGPTLEFYSSVSKEFCNKKLLLWRNGDELDDGDEYIRNKSGLFPAPLSKQQLNSENGKKILFFFNVLGKFVARGMLDSRIVDFNFNPVFFKIIMYLLKQQAHQNLRNVFPSMQRFTNLLVLRQIDPLLADSIEMLIRHKQNGDDFEDLGLTFELPGYPQYEIVNRGNDIPINAKNLEKYILKVIEATTYSGVVHQIKAFMDGFSKVFPINSLIIFSPEELISILGNGEEDWSQQTLLSSINADHGYTKESPTIKYLINILTQFDKIERRLFLQFLTGAPKLPIGGFNALKPELTVVKKLAEDGLKDDDYLPSVMTCANYLKLPNYSSEELMRKKILQAMNDGAGAFLLS